MTAQDKGYELECGKYYIDHSTIHFCVLMITLISAVYLSLQVCHNHSYATSYLSSFNHGLHKSIKANSCGCIKVGRTAQIIEIALSICALRQHRTFTPEKSFSKVGHRARQGAKRYMKLTPGEWLQVKLFLGTTLLSPKNEFNKT